MILQLIRKVFTANSTIGELSVDGVFECYTLEDVVRKPDEAKVHGKTAIPAGSYRVLVTMSNRFKRLLPLLADVPNFEGIRIHPGNTAENTDGCLLVGRDLGVDFIGRSREAFDRLFPKITRAIDRGEPVRILIS